MFTAFIYYIFLIWVAAKTVQNVSVPKLSYSIKQIKWNVQKAGSLPLCIGTYFSYCYLHIDRLRRLLGMPILFPKTSCLINYQLNNCLRKVQGGKWITLQCCLLFPSLGRDFFWKQVCASSIVWDVIYLQLLFFYEVHRKS